MDRRGKAGVLEIYCCKRKLVVGECRNIVSGYDRKLPDHPDRRIPKLVRMANHVTDFCSILLVS